MHPDVQMAIVILAGCALALLYLTYGVKEPINCLWGFVTRKREAEIARLKTELKDMKEEHRREALRQAEIIVGHLEGWCSEHRWGEFLRGCREMVRLARQNETMFQEVCENMPLYSTAPSPTPPESQ